MKTGTRSALFPFHALIMGTNASPFSYFNFFFLLIISIFFLFQIFSFTHESLYSARFPSKNANLFRTSTSSPLFAYLLLYVLISFY